MPPARLHEHGVAECELPRLCRLHADSSVHRSLNRCIELAKREQVVLMCAEAVPWRCHRSLIADALVARGIEASEITSRVRTRPHSLTPWAQVTGTRVTYPAAGVRSGQSEAIADGTKMTIR